MRSGRGTVARWNRMQLLTSRSAPQRKEYATILMVSAVTGAACGVAETVLEIGRSAGWWT